MGYVRTACLFCLLFAASMMANAQATPPSLDPASPAASIPDGPMVCVAPPSGLVGWWPGDSNANDIAGGHNASALNAVNFVPGEVRNGFTFGSQGGIQIPDSSNLKNQQFTWIAWARPDGPGPNNDENGSVIIKHSDGRIALANLQWRATDYRFLFFFGSIASERIESAHTFAPGTFYLVAGTYDGSTFRLFVNGAIEGSFARTKMVPYGSFPWIFGSTGIQCSAACRTWNGVIDEVQAYSRALSAAEILSIFQAGSAGVCKDAAAGGGVGTASDALARLSPPIAGSPSGGVYQPGNGVSAPSVLSKVEPEYTEVALKLRVAEGTVVLQFVVQPDGTARDFKVLMSMGYGLDEKAIEAVRKWRFKPSMKDGKAVPGAMHFAAHFHMLQGPGADTWTSGQMVFASEAGLAAPVVKDGTMPKPVREFSNDDAILEFTVDASGSVKNIHAIHGSASASGLLAGYLATWRFEPAMKGNRPVEATGRVRFVKGQGDQSALSKPSPQSTPPQQERAPQTSAPPVDGGQTRTMMNPTDGQRYVWIPQGDFTMGCSPGDTECAGDEKPPHAERIARGFWLGQTEVTQAAYQRVTGGNPSSHKGDHLPVESLTWNHAVNYCTAIGGRLPTEGEWEYAARAGVAWARYTSLDEVAWHSGNSGGAIHPVAMKTPNAFGLYDMLGNVWEYIAGSYPGSLDKILRGGAWRFDSTNARASSRLRSEPSGSGPARGFRCAGEWSGAEKSAPGAPPVSAAPVRTVSPPVVEPRDSIVNEKDGQRYVWIPPGSFTMGCSQGDTECNDNENAPHAEEIANGFWLSQTEVTQAAYQRVVGRNPSHNKGDQLPVESVTWNEANQYCGSIGGHLPTEAEWEYAARGQAGITGSRYGSVDAVAWHSGNSGGTTHPVALKQPNAFGLYDMLGNVWEWVEDSFTGDSIIRGGSSEVYPGNVRASVRSVVAPSDSTPNRGFRCAGEWPVPEKTPPGGKAVTPPQTVSSGGGPINGVYRVGGGVSAPALLRKVEPEYSEEARKAKYQGTVLLQIDINPSGKAINIRVMHSLGLGLDQKAMEAVKKWKFRPGFKDGKAVTVEAQIQVNFRLL